MSLAEVFILEHHPAFLGWDERFTPQAARICAWCDRQKELTERLDRCGVDTTHGICPTCNAEMIREAQAATAHEELINAASALGGRITA